MVAHAELVRYAAGEWFIPDDFVEHDAPELDPAFTAALVVRHHATIEPGPLTADVLLAVGTNPISHPDRADT
jgi:hypothetical protein